MRLRVARAVALIGAAVTGLFVAHELDYRLLVPDPLHRHDLLLRTGHGYLSRAVFLVLLAAMVAAVASVAVGLARSRDPGGGACSLRGTVGLLAFVQSAGFVTLEATERVLAGAPPDDRLLLVTLTGVGVQVLTAFIAAILLRLLARTAEAIGRALAVRYVPIGVRPAHVLLREQHTPRTFALGTLGARAPPSLAW